MFSRRLLRIKVLQIAYAHSKSGDTDFNNSEKELFYSIEKAFDLYHYLLLLLIDIADYAQSRIDIAKEKRIPTEEDLNPNKRFTENKIVSAIRDDEKFMNYIQSKKLTWVKYPELIRDTYKVMLESSVYKKYMEDEENDFDKDKKFITKFYTEIIANSEDLFEILENQSIYWNDDIEFIISMIVKTVKQTLSESTESMLQNKYKNDEDAEFTRQLFRKTLLHQKENREIIEKFTLNWDFDRIAFMDVLIMQMALTEVKEFPSIPIKVTLNEYLDLAKFFSTRNSSNFVNGVLDKAINQLKKQNKIKKQGRGLIGEV